MLVLHTNEGDKMSNAASRARKRDNAEKLGELQVTLNLWLNSTSGQVTLLVMVGATILLAGLIGR